MRSGYENTMMSGHETVLGMEMITDAKNKTVVLTA